MARRSSLWAELRRERERRERESRRAHKVQQQLIRQAAKEHDQAVVRSARAESAERRRQEQLAHEARTTEAAERTTEVEARAEELGELLRSSLERQVAELTREVAEHNAAVDKLAADFHAGAPDAVEEYFEQVLAQSVYPEEFPHDYEVAYRPEPLELVINTGCREAK